jgi:phosphatidylserine/phosphatidylglycerophosphate/cardiolipin synthase-like enzyme
MLFLQKGILATGIFLLLLPGLPAQEDIAAARARGPGATVTVRGIVTSGPELGVIRFLQDHSGALAAWSPDLSQVKRGDSVTLTGVLKDYQSLLELDPVQDFTVHSSGNPLPEATVLTPGQFSQRYESMLVRVEGATFNTSGSFRMAAYPFVASGEQGQVYINSDQSPLVGFPIPEKAVTITGPLGSYLGTFQLLPRDQADFEAISSIVLRSPPGLASLTREGFSLRWSTSVAGSTEAFVGHSPDLEMAPVKLPGPDTAHLLSFGDMSPSELLYVQPFSVAGNDTARAALQAHMTVSDSDGWMRALFNGHGESSGSPGSMESPTTSQELDRELVGYIRDAELSIDMAIYNLDNRGISNISQALNDAHARGVEVRVIYDRDRDPRGVKELDPGIGKLASPQSDYPHYGIMHHKFVVIDALSPDPAQALVWTGSTNLSASQILTDPNNVIVVQDQSLAKTYRLEFNEMFGSEGPQPDASLARFGPDKRDDTPHEFLIGGIRTECYFSPSDGTHRKILECIHSSGYSAHVATMLMTREDLAEALVQRANAGSTVQVQLHEVDSYSWPPVQLLMQHIGQDLHVWTGPGIMHHKYLVVDQERAHADPLVLTGSHNWSNAARLRNDENTLIIHDQAMALAYYQNFVSCFENGSIQLSESLPPASRPAISIRPNPARDAFRVDIPRGSAIRTLLIHDLQGRQVLRAERPGEDLFSLAGLRSGLYLIKITLTDGQGATQKLMVW